MRNENINDTYFEEYYENGQLEEKGILKNGIREGTYEKYYRSGVLFETGNYVDGKKHGSCRVFDQKGVFSENSVYVKGEHTGPYELFYEGGKNLFRKGFYKNGKCFGKQEEFWENGQLRSKGIWGKNDKKIKIEEFYNEDGQKRMDVTKEVDLLGTGNGFFYEEGKIGGLKYFKNGKEEGSYKRYYITGELFCTGNLKGDTHDGIYQVFHKNGQLKEKSIYKNGEIVE